MEIETKSASLDTMTVTIQALHVNGKQMTMSVFRQLPAPDESWNEQSHPQARPWGWVKYKYRDATHWLVFSLNGQLWRRALRLRASADRLADHKERDLALGEFAIMNALPQLFIAV
jgi:hypothetical protein